MSFGDDDDEDAEEPERTRSQLSTQSQEPSGAESFMPDVNSRLLQVLDEEEDVVIPQSHPSSSSRARTPVPQSAPARPQEAPSAPPVSHPASGSRSRSNSTPQKLSRRGTLESLLSPLANFIDFREDEGSTRSWRSFVEFSS